ncbi:MAG: hypothetical protein AB7O62_06745 [Pirellulales bacterium]
MKIHRFVVVASGMLCAVLAGNGQAAEDGAAMAIFKRRILPILQAKNPSSCAECHLSGVDLKDYIRADQMQTFAALRDAGLIDVQRPRDSKLLAFIARQPKQPGLVSNKVRQEELAAFTAWILAATGDKQLLAAKADGQLLGVTLPPEVIRHARHDRVLNLFVENIWSEVGRCAACHAPDRNQQQVQEHGDRVSWIKLQNPQATLDHLVDAGLIDTEDPGKSLLLLKPTLQVEHGGGQKMMVGDRTYRQFKRFLDDYSAVIQGNYRRKEELPPQADEVSQASDVWLKLTGVPANLDKLLLRVDVYSTQAPGKAAVRVATGDRAVFGGGQLWQQHLTFVARRKSKRAKTLAANTSLPPGKYLLKIFVDRRGQLAQDSTYELGDDDFVGQVEIDAHWPAGYGSMTVARFPQ